MSSLLLVSYSHKIVDYKRKKEAKKEKVVIVAYLLIISNTNLKDTTMLPIASRFGQYAAAYCLVKDTHRKAEQALKKLITHNS